MEYTRSLVIPHLLFQLNMPQNNPKRLSPLPSELGTVLRQQLLVLERDGDSLNFVSRPLSAQIYLTVATILSIRPIVTEPHSCAAEGLSRILHYSG